MFFERTACIKNSTRKMVTSGHKLAYFSHKFSCARVISILFFLYELLPPFPIFPPRASPILHRHCDPKGPSNFGITWITEPRNWSGLP